MQIPVGFDNGQEILIHNQVGRISKRELVTPSQKKMDFFSFELKQTPFALDRRFLDTFVDEQPKWGPIGYVTYKRTYARPLADGEAEEFWQTCQRVVEGVYRIQQRHCQMFNLPWFPGKAQRSAQRMFQMMWDFKFLPPGRGLWMMGTDFIERAGGAALNNCAFVSTDQIHVSFSAPFCFLMDMSMLGVGVGGDCRGAGLVTVLKPVVDMHDVHEIEDSREGWVEAMRRLLDAYVGKDTMPVSWDPSKIRGPGQAIKGFGGVSSGPGPLMQLLEHDIPMVLDRLIGLPINSEAITDLFNFIGKCVVSGNVRRSAEIMFGNPNDTEFLELKNPKIHKAEMDDRRWASNNSIFAKVGMNYSDAAERTRQAGEPGYEWLENARAFGRMIDPADFKDIRAAGGNPCLEQTLESFELCCLVETFPINHSSYEEYEQTLKMAYLYAKTVTLVPTHDPRTNAVLMRNRRIGTSQSGIVQSFKKIGRRAHLAWCDNGYKYLRKLDKIYSDWLCVPVSIKITSVKPSGTVSLLAGVTPGIHYPIAEYYIRRMRVADISPLAEALKRGNVPWEVDKKTPNTLVFSFMVKEEYFTKSESQVSMWEQLLNAVSMQRYWADNQVSCTVKFRRGNPYLQKKLKTLEIELRALVEGFSDEHYDCPPDVKIKRVTELRQEMDCLMETIDQIDEGKDVEAALELLEDQLKGISFLPHTHGYEQAPIEEISRERYEEYVAHLSQLDLTLVQNEVQDKMCDSSSCQLT